MSELVYSNVSKTGVWGRNPAAACGYGGLFVSFVSFCWAIFVSFWKKKYFNLIGSHFARVQRLFKELDFYYFKANRKDLVVQSSFCN